MTNNQLLKYCEDLEIRITNAEVEIENAKQENSKLRRKVCRLLKKHKAHKKMCRNIHSTFMY